MVKGLFSESPLYECFIILSKVKKGSEDIVLSSFRKAFPEEPGFSSWKAFFYHSLNKSYHQIGGMAVYDMPDSMRDSWFLAMEESILDNPNQGRIPIDLLGYAELYQSLFLRKKKSAGKVKDPFDLAGEWIGKMDGDDDFFDKINVLTAPMYRNSYFRESENFSSMAFYESLLEKIHSRIF